MIRLPPSSISLQLATCAHGRCKEKRMPAKKLSACKKLPAYTQETRSICRKACRQKIERQQISIFPSRVARKRPAESHDLFGRKLRRDTEAPADSLNLLHRGASKHMMGENVGGIPWESLPQTSIQRKMRWHKFWPCSWLFVHLTSCLLLSATREACTKQP